MSNLVEHAKVELALLDDGSEIQKLMNDGLIEIVEVFAKQGHSGFSAGYAIRQLEKLLRFEPLKPLTGADDEWNETGVGEYQNKRCSHVFKDATGAYDINGIVWIDDKGNGYTNFESRVPVTFPYTPKTEEREAPKVEA